MNPPMCSGMPSSPMASIYQPLPSLYWRGVNLGFGGGGGAGAGGGFCFMRPLERLIVSRQAVIGFATIRLDHYQTATVATPFARMLPRVMGGEGERFGIPGSVLI
jgi:hypothetical protein